MNLGETICRLRTDAGLSQNDLAGMLNVSRQSVSKWETNTSVPDLDNLIKLAQIFGVSLDQLVTDAQPQVQTAPSAPVPPKKCSPIQIVGIVFLCITIILSIFTIFPIAFMGIFGIIYIMPTLVFGLICIFAKKHPLLKAFWADYLILDLYMSYATGIRASAVLLTFHWTYEMNYARLLIAWVLFFMVAALVICTAVTLRKHRWTGSKKQKGFLLLAAFVFLLASTPLSFRFILYIIPSLLFLSWARLWALTVLAVALARYIYTKRHP